MTRKLMFGALAQPVEAKTAAYTVKERDCGKLFTNEGAAGSVTFTLPKVGSLSALKGFWVEFANVAAQAIVVASDPADSMVGHNDADLDSITTATTIGQHIKVICIGEKWLIVSNPSAASAATAVTAVTLTD